MACGTVRRCNQGCTVASSSLCSWVNQGWRGCMARSFSMSSASTSCWSLEEEQEEEAEERGFKMRRDTKHHTHTH